MKVLHVLGPHLSLPATGYGGVERVVEALVNRQCAAGVDVGTFTVGTSRIQGRLHWHYAAPTLRHDDEGRAIWDRTHDYIQAGKAAELADTYDVIHNHSEFALPIFSMSRVPVLTTLHSYTASDGPSDRLVDAFPGARRVAISESQRSLLRGGLLATPKVLNPMSLDVMASSPKVESSGSHVLFLGAMSPNKGADIAISAAIAVNRGLILAGPLWQGDEAFLHDVVAPLSIGKKVRWVGAVGGAVKADLLRNAAVLLCPPRWNEPFGLAAIEAMGMGTPVAALRRGALSEIVDEGITGYTVENPVDLPDALEQAAKLDREACAAWARKRFDPEHAATSYQRLYEDAYEIG